MSLTVKAFLEKNGKPDSEIRRFQIPADVSSSYAYLSKKVADIFPGLRDGKFALYWRDPDGDMVLFSTDEEQLEALGFVTDTIFKVYVKASEAKADTGPPQEPQGEIHPGIVCDGCNGEVRGQRFKCLVCPDYDLCSVCEGQGLHSEHNMMKMAKPMGSQCFPPPMGCPFPGPPPFHGHHGRHHGHPRPGEPFAPPPHFRRWMRKFMKRWHNKNSPGCQHDDKDDSPDDQEGDTITEEEYLKSVGDSVANMLDPLGIDVQIDVERGGKRVCRGRGRGRGWGQGRGCCMRGHSWGPEAMPRSQSPKRKVPGQGNGKKEKKASESTGSMENPIVVDVMKDVAMETEKDVEQQAEALEEEITNKTQQMALVDEGLDGSIKEADTQPKEPARMDVQRSKDVEDNTWTLLSVSPPNAQPLARDMPDSAVAPITVQPPLETQIQAPPTVAGPPGSGTVASSSQSNSGRSVQFQVQPEVSYPPTNPRIAEALQQMLAMGFNNDDGWLTRLLESKNGDIIQVLDAIKPQPGRNNRQTNNGYMA